MANAKTKTLFKKAYHHNWDNGISGLKKILADKDCDKATALLIFWYGSPDYFYNRVEKEKLADYEIPQYHFLKQIEADILSGKYPVFISYVVDENLLPHTLGNIPAELAIPTEGTMGYKEILWPNNNPFQDQILALCHHCPSINDIYELEKQGADFSLKILNGYSYPIVVAVNSGNVEAIKYFLEKGFDLNKKYNKSPLLCNTLYNKNIEAVKLFVESGVNVNQKGEFGRTVLHSIAGFGDLNGGFDEKMEAIVRYLIANGADIQAKDSDKKTPLDLATMWKNERYIEFIKTFN